ncbi:AcrR family transcriptional regulator [Agromyces hippuratus]|uniref:AcrR family transcriptional regulator n=1 Tax=Agromyces hippuratus TaxID=286438 RepID=A0A852X7S2_9MICO|nr:TetR family transcriptional regulator [Agromyces hippuratus]NYG22011.1 AcrR family transcriptional regulator [Agromyces hippuratus]
MFENTTGAPRTKAERTRARIRDTALASFRERGYDETTVRLIAQEAGVSLGNAYYYFPTKNHLVQELYVEVQREHRAAAEPLLGESTDLIDRLGVVYRTGLTTLEPFHRFAPGFLSAAVSPKSPINPLAAESTEARDLAVGLFDEAVAGARHSLPDDLARSLPEVFWLGYLLLALFWVYDTSPGQERTLRLLDRGLKLLALALPLVKLPLLRKPLRELVELIGEVRA